MAILRSDEIQGMSDSEVDERLIQLKKELMKINGVLASGGIPEEVGKVREIKRTIARIKTVQKSREKAEQKPKKKKSVKKSSKKASKKVSKKASNSSKEVAQKK